MVPPPWNEKFEAGWEAPQGAMKGSLLRGLLGQYVATLEWASRADCEAWLQDDSMQAARSSTTIFEVCRRRGQETSNQQTELSSFDLRSPNIDPRILFAIAAGEAVDIAAEDEVLVSGGDPAFLDDSKWRTPDAAGSNAFATSSFGSLDAAAARAALIATMPSGSSGEDPERDELDELIFAGGDPSFLDDKYWPGRDAQVCKSSMEEEWDGKEDDNAHFD